jgi:general secretion pathway protein D
MKNIKNFSLGLIIAICLSACASNSPDGFSPDKSYLQKTSVTTPGQEQKQNKLTVNGADLLSQSQNRQLSGMTHLSSLSVTKDKTTKNVDLTEKFSANEFVQLTADDLPLKDYLHYVMGDLLEVSYILGEQVKADNKTVTLNLQKDINKQKLYSVSEALLTERGYVIRFDDGIYYIHQSEGANSQGNVAYGYGIDISDVPNTSVNIIQFVPFTFGMQTSLANTLQQILKIKATPDFQRNTIILQGKRKDIVRALEFINLMDQPLFKNRHIGVYKGTYVSTSDLVEKLPKLLKQEGISVSGKDQNDQAVSLVPLEHIGTLVLFANSKQIIERVGFWAQQIDQAPSGNQLQYFLYAPQFARATDLGESLQVLIGGSSPALGSTTSAAAQNTKSSQSNKNSSSNISATGEDMTLVVDERANALIFNTTGDKYRQLLPLIKRLDVMPKQVLLEVMIAEVKLSDTFKQGVDFVLTNQGDAAKVGGFELKSGATGLSYALSGAQGSINFNLLQTNTNVNVLSRPSLLVRDGVKANITVGDDIPTVGQIITDPVNGSQTSVVYRKTGVELQVKPTINARGVVIMEINQKISNQATGDDSVAGSPIIFERSITTEVVAESGQTIVLGGLISENRTFNDTSVPFFSSIPLIGKLFDSKNDTGDKTELVVLVTPRVIESVDEWSEIMTKFTSQFSQLYINQ